MVGALLYIRVVVLVLILILMPHATMIPYIRTRLGCEVAKCR